MTNIETNGGNPADDAALLDAVLSGPAPSETADDGPEPEATEAKAEPATEQTAPETVATSDAPEQRAKPRVPLTELMEERRARQEVERQLAELRGSFQQFQQMQARQTQAPQQDEQPPDWLEDPAGFIAYQQQPVVSRFERQLQRQAADIASLKFGEDEVRKAAIAFDQAEQSGQLHPADVQRVKSSVNPYAEAVNWYRERTVLTETGGDLKSFLAKREEQLLSDPEFRKRAMAAWQTQAQAAAPTNPRPVIDLPSIAKVGAAALPGKSGTETDAALLAEVLGRSRGPDGRFK